MLLETAICLDWLWESCYNKLDSNSGKFDMTYKEIITNNPDITAEEFYGTLIQGGKTDIEIFDLFADAIRSGNGVNLRKNISDSV